MSSVNESRARAARFVSAKVFVRGLTVDAEIGVYAHERGRRQPLIVDVELDVAPGGWRTIGETVNYERIVGHARTLADGGHILLVETFAWRLARACLAEPCALRVRVRVEKPHALAPQAQAAGVEIIVERD
ncbi:MAG TPA: dihydroneopterin aldolase [Caulobacteraceae bacterium]|nr:dihydroneopterin aldolase [Caulobacteraceae bacterium]